MTAMIGAALVALAVVLVLRRLDVRLVLLLTALALGVVGGEPMAIVRVFLATFSNERFVVPICTAMGFAYVMRLTGCDKHLVHLLVRPLTRVRFLLLPGTVVVGFLVNIPVVSQTSTAATLGPVIIPILQAAGFSPVTIGASLLLGSSVGGELLNPGAPELRTIVEETDREARKQHLPPPGLQGRDCVRRILPLNLIGLAVSTLVFWAMSRRDRPPSVLPEAVAMEAGFRVRLHLAFIPMLPLVLLFLTAPPLELIKVPPGWLVDRPKKLPQPREVALALAADPAAGFPAGVPWAATSLAVPPPAGLSPTERGLFDSRLIGLAMLIGTAVAGLVVRQKALGVAGAFFEGAGYGFANIISLIVAANCFGEGVRQVGLHHVIGQIDSPTLLLPAAALVPMAFAVLCGSGMASTQSLFGIFVGPALRLNMDPTLVGAVVSLASAAGRTLSPFAAVAFLCARLTDTNSFDLARRVFWPLLAGIIAIVLAAIVMASTG